MAAKKSNQVTAIEALNSTTMEVFIKGTSPLLMNAMSEKVMQELLMPARRKTSGDKARTLKHDPLSEYRRSCYLLSGPNQPTLVAHMATAFKESLRTAALEVGGTTKAQMGRLTYVVGDMVPIWGIPQMHMSVVRQAGMNRTPDVRTRAIFPEWAAAFRINFVTPNLDAQSVANLLLTAGVICGIGDGRPEKGKMSYGQFTVTSGEDPDFNRIVATGGRDAQLQALYAPTFYDAQTEELYAYFESQLDTRGFDRQSSVVFDRIWNLEMERK